MASFYIRKSGASGWIAVIQEYKEGKKSQRSLKSEEYQVFGLNHHWPLDEAKQQIKKLNKLNKVETQRKSRAARHANLLKTQKYLYVDESLAVRFQEYLLENILSGDIERAEKNKVLIHWKIAQKIISTLQLLPTQYGQNAGRFVSYFMKREFSPDYCIKLLKIINHFGEFCAQHQNQFYKHIKLSRTQIQQIRDKYLYSDNYRGPSDRLSPEMLDNKKPQLSDENYRWLYISVWLGLRPQEIDKICSKKFGHKLEFDKRHKIQFIQIYQSKLKSVAEEKRWKAIPLIFDEQKKIIEYLKRPLKRPTYKTMKRVFGGSIKCYAGRKNFTDLMLDRGRKIEEISTWLGHSTIETTWKFYKDKHKLTLLEPA